MCDNNKEITSVPQFLNEVNDQTEEKGYLFWYRGHSNNKQWELQPTQMTQIRKIFADINFDNNRPVILYCLF